MKSKEQRNKKLIILLLLLLIGATAIFFYFRKEKTAPIVFSPQGKTEIPAGNISLEIWDSSAEDGDTVQLYFKEKLIADTLAILNEPVIYKLGNLAPGSYWIGVRALSEGSSSPASAAMKVMNGKDDKYLVMDAWIDSAASWELIVK